MYKTINATFSNHKMSTLEKYNKFITELKSLKEGNYKADDLVFDRFKASIDEMKLILDRFGKRKDRNETLNRYRNTYSSILKLKESVLHRRTQETKNIIELNKEKLMISAFELMEHNFRENSHSNVLKYVFNYKYLNDEGVTILFNFLKSIYGKEINRLKHKLDQKNYTIHREYSTGNGRIDLLIEDSKNKFVIVIENKLLASIGERQIEQDNQSIAQTQLDVYRNYIYGQNKYQDHDKLFIVLSYADINDFSDTDFVYADYNQLHEALSDVVSEDIILNQYKILLQSIINRGIDKEWLIELSNKIMNNQKIDNLAELETINKYLS